MGIWVGESEGAKFWLGVCNELKNRGVEDIFIACVDGLTGFPDAIRAVFPKTEVQLCIIHQIRNSLKYVASKEQKEFMKDLKLVYRAPSEEIAFSELDRMASKWGKKYSEALKKALYLATIDITKKWTSPMVSILFSRSSASSDEEAMKIFTGLMVV